MAEGVLRLALDIWDVLLPSSLHLSEDCGWDCELGGARVDESGVAWMWEVCEVFAVVEHTLAKESPWFEIALIVFEDF